MVWHVIDRYQFLALSGDDAGHVFLKFIVMLSLGQALPSLHSENNLNVDLGVRIRHFYVVPTELQATSIKSRVCSLIARGE